MKTLTLPAGPRKLIIGDLKACERNRNRAQASLTAQAALNAEARVSRTAPAVARPAVARPVYAVLVLNDAGEVEATYAANLARCEATLCYSVNGLAKSLPGAAAALRAITDERCFFWAESTDALTLLDLAE